MAHYTCAAALTSARAVLSEFDLVPLTREEIRVSYIPNLRPDETCLAIAIDLASGLYHLAMLRPKLTHIQKGLYYGTVDAPQVGRFFQEVLEAFAKLPQKESGVTIVAETPPEFGGKTVKQTISPPAWEASRAVFTYYKVAAKQGVFKNDVLRIMVAKYIEAGSRISRALEALPMISYWQEKFRHGQATADDIKKCLREVGIRLENLPNYQDREEETKLL